MRTLLFLVIVFTTSSSAIRADDDRPTQSAQAVVAPAPLELVLGIRSPSQTDRLSLAPDGKHVAYTIARSRAIESSSLDAASAAPAAFRGLRLHVVDATNGKLEWSSGESVSAWASSWSPDGKRVAFYSDEGGVVGVWSYRVGDFAAKRLGTCVVGAFHHMRPEWTPDGSRILVPTIASVADRDSARSTEASTNPAPTDSARTNPVQPNSARNVESAAAPNVVVRRTGLEVLAEPPATPTVSEPAIGPSRMEQSLVAGPPAALSAVDASDGTCTEILPAGARSRFLAAKISPSGRILACEASLRAVFDGGLSVLLDLELVRCADGAVLHRVEGIAIDVNIDPTSPTLAMMAWHPTEDRLAYVHAGRLILVDLTAPEPSVREFSMGTSASSAARVSFTPDGRTLLVSVLATTSSVEDPFLERVLAISTKDASQRELVAPDGVKLRGVVSANWRTTWQPEEDAIVAAGTDMSTNEALVLRMPLDATPANVIRRIEGRVRVVAALERGRAVALVEGVTTAPDYFVIGTDLVPALRLSRAEPLLATVDVGPVESFVTEIESNGERRRVHASVALPPGGKKGGAYPTIVTFYPGREMSREARSFGGGDVASIPAPIFTTRGYAVVVLDVPLAPFGVPSDPLRDIQAAVVPAVGRAVELGYTDARRVGVVGHSYGAYGVACSVCSSSAFQGAVAISGSYDLAGTYAEQRADEPETDGLTMNMVYAEQHQGRMGKPLWADPKRYLDNSPYFRADEIHTPMLLLHGGADTNCPQSEAEKLFNALRRLGGTAQLAIYEGEGHVPSEWSRANRLDMTTRTLAFFERFVKADGTARR
ncbi:MAG: prolyl oligopeptidase family serine peptidase [Planctomycetes bacterium]|nr:prolyl oligopeptidase family serine peptidase [Planctomycetota bacterium]MCC7170006.1 prolyl oligopeptidase family serine peptidase [Planctomycetota bacterium]